uniref:ATP synthase F0 subunit 6 n=1 Tax=Dollfustrema vaneyi TaxID=438518 RepID=A0AAU7N3P3_9TREM
MLQSRLNGIFSFICGFVGSYSFIYCFMVFLMLCVFVVLRVPYLYGLGGFLVFLVGFISPLYLSFFLSRLSCFGVSFFLSSFVPVGSPLWIAPFVALAETISYIVRPVVLLIRPFLNISIGAIGGGVLGSLFFQSWGVSFFLFVLFFYEIFVALVHWFIVCNILSFSSDH